MYLALAVMGVWIAAGLLVETALLRRQLRFLSQPEVADEAARCHGRQRAVRLWSQSLDAVMRLLIWLAAGLLAAKLCTPHQLHMLSDVVPAVYLLPGVLIGDALLREPWHGLQQGGASAGLTRAERWHRATQGSGKRLLRRIVWALAAPGLLVVIHAVSIAMIGPMNWPVTWLMVGGLVAGTWLFEQGFLPQIAQPIKGRQEPLPAGSLRGALEAMTAESGARLTSLWQVRAQEDAQLPAAYIAGIGRRRRIVVSQALLSFLDEQETAAVLAHELAHYRCGHLHRYHGALGALLIGYITLGGWLLSWLGLPAVAVLILLYLLRPLVAWPLVPWQARCRRCYEFEADAFAARYASREGLIRALQKLLAVNPNRAGMDRWYAAYHATHPEGGDRLARLACEA